MALGIGVIAVSALGTVGWKNLGNLWGAQIQQTPNCPHTIRVCGGLAQDVQMIGPDCDIIPPCTEFCGNGAVDEWEQCGEPTLSCASNQNCVGCLCLPLGTGEGPTFPNVRVCSVVRQCPDGTPLLPRPFCEFGQCPQCGNWALDPGESCEVGVCCPLGKVCDVHMCVCVEPSGGGP
ncbi:MAG: hypothetical protein PeribacterA2_1134 [Candidatus Peribacter riflensis]|uniref:Uncharacterized protein n=1 Tax=Candidatus Peribacter riflensis TaxID=1735162 RepID=A0A0S1SVP9_9BACT|nr:MAG: hypothetical protein PeribacterA2_1134 [Candidatus Peribacter riflensis]ALM11589.1 MAG: hypothetical protein PeribacterB2_1136 [Candidatus Peribacter riflensis]ALM12691.1 MAG: hypothetical protein PeribacterC2_1135 [Candidatus Peribacter riflensis]ALM13792.1 MAG: hypothetical protein PeribacterD1_1134 [Candidatus Peribacter riflensis]ALM14895.1 MAG: hypothetical protein PeribacterD2_1136 [Candidatus Peribacter riflensis]